MIHWLEHQFAELNVIAIVIIFTFVTAMSKTNTQKMLTKQSEEFNKKIDEVKDEMRGQNSAISRLCEQILGKN